MRHRKKLHRLGRPRGHRRLLLKNLAVSLIMHGSIETTETKAKALRSYMSLIMRSVKNADQMHAIRRLQTLLHNEKASRRLLTDLKKKFENRSSGFTKITPVKYRKGDNALVTRIELI